MIVFAGLMRTDIDRARIALASYYNFRSKRDLLDRMGQSYLPKNLLPRFDTVMGRVKHLSEKRNLLAHRRAYHIKKGTFRFFNDEDPTQPNTFGRYTDIQTATIRVWCKELSDLQKDVLEMGLSINRARLLTQPRVLPEPTQDHGILADPDPNAAAEPRPPQQPSRG
jgi:hypothetical protein